jgi:hypothetical protein
VAAKRWEVMLLRSGQTPSRGADEDALIWLLHLIEDRIAGAIRLGRRKFTADDWRQTETGLAVNRVIAARADPSKATPKPRMDANERQFQWFQFAPIGVDSRLSFSLEP